MSQNAAQNAAQEAADGSGREAADGSGAGGQAPAEGTPTLRLDRDALAEGWAERDRLPRVTATLKMGAKTDLGRVRENNEDKFDFFEPEDPAVLATKGAFYGVADGMGGHSAGQIACELALKTVIQSYYARPSADADVCLRRAVEEANALIYDTSQMIPDRHGMGTTLTAAVVRDDQAIIAQVGDSRAYLVRAGDITQLTADHSWVAEQVRLGAMTLEAAQASPFRNIITRSIGTAAAVEPDVVVQPLQAGDILLLCSDGLSGHLDAAEMRDTVLAHAPSAAALRLVEQANERGGRDNITALVLAVRALAPYSGAAALPTMEGAEGAEPAPAKPERRGWGLRR